MIDWQKLGGYRDLVMYEERLEVAVSKAIAQEDAPVVHSGVVMKQAKTLLEDVQRLCPREYKEMQDRVAKKLACGWDGADFDVCKEASEAVQSHDERRCEGMTYFDRWQERTLNTLLRESPLAEQWVRKAMKRQGVREVSDAEFALYKAVGLWT